MTNSALRGVFVLFVMLLAACTSSGPKTAYYSLFPESNIVVNSDTSLNGSGLTFGVGPIVLPEYVDHPGIVSVNNSNRVTVSGYNAWAGDLQENISRVLASNLSARWDVDQVWAFPWDNRVRPFYQVRLVFEDFSGVRGGEVNIVARWTLLNAKGNTSLAVGVERIKTETTSAKYNDYVAALNTAVNELSQRIAEKVAKEVSP